MRKVIGYISALILVTSLVSCNKWSRNKEIEAAPSPHQSNHTASTESGRRKHMLTSSLGPPIPSSRMSTPSEENSASANKAAGEARVNLPLSESQISSGSLDVLYPLYEDDKRLLFNQLGLRRSENRNILNLGLGQRHYGAGWLAGYNAFYDAQISGSPHQRLGLGVEYRRDYLHLAVNGYYGLTGWRAVHAISGHDERVAHGYDIRAQGWLPSLPQFSGKLKFENYFGEGVAFGKHASRGRNPYALTLGIGYTPVPLITFGLDNIFYRHGGSNTTFGLSLNYQLGVPLAQQLDPGNLAIKGKVADSRYRLVERNNHIVLDYQQTSQQPEFSLPPTIEGYPGETKLLKYTFRSAFRLKSIQWDDHALRARGGNIRQLGAQAFAIHFPYHQPAGSNQMIISAVANDEHGNTSNRSEITVSVLPLQQYAQLIGNDEVSQGQQNDSGPSSHHQPLSSVSDSSYQEPQADESRSTAPTHQASDSTTADQSSQNNSGDKPMLAPANHISAQTNRENQGESENVPTQAQEYNNDSPGNPPTSSDISQPLNTGSQEECISSSGQTQHTPVIPPPTRPFMSSAEKPQHLFGEQKKTNVQRDQNQPLKTPIESSSPGVEGELFEKNATRRATLEKGEVHKEFELRKSDDHTTLAPQASKNSQSSAAESHEGSKPSSGQPHIPLKQQLPLPQVLAPMVPPPFELETTQDSDHQGADLDMIHDQSKNQQKPEVRRDLEQPSESPTGNLSTESSTSTTPVPHAQINSSSNQSHKAPDFMQKDQLPPPPPPPPQKMGTNSPFQDVSSLINAKGKLRKTIRVKSNEGDIPLHRISMAERRVPVNMTEAEKEEILRIIEKVKVEKKNNRPSDIGTILQRRVMVEESSSSSDEEDDCSEWW